MLDGTRAFPLLGLAQAAAAERGGPAARPTVPHSRAGSEPTGEGPPRLQSAPRLRAARSRERRVA